MRREVGANGRRTTSDIYEVYTQPLPDYVRARAYHVWDRIMWRTRIEKLQDKIWERRNKFWHVDIEDIDELPPSVEHDCKCFTLDTKNERVIGRIEVPRKEKP